MSGDYSKTRPAVVIQNDDVADILNSRTIALMTSQLAQGSLYRLTVEPAPQNGLDRVTQVQVDKITSLPKSKLCGSIGRLTENQMRDIDLALLRHLDIRGHGIE